MNREKEFYLTKKGIDKLKKEYETLRKLRVAKTGEEIPQILESEDLNPEYLSFREDLNLLETRMFELENVLKNTKLIKKPPKAKQNIIYLGAIVSVDIDGEVDEFQIVGTLEVDPSKNKISDESPIGQALLGKGVGEIVVVRTPVRNPIVNHICKIIKIKYS